MTDQTPTTENVERSRFNVAGVHHIIGTECLCGVRRLHKNRDRTEHILDAFIKELDLATHDRAVKAAALREVADEVRHYDSRATPRGIAASITTRANRIEAGDE